jgi:hypothetical protein
VTEPNEECWEGRFDIHVLFGCFSKKDGLVYPTDEVMIEAKTIILQHDQRSEIFRNMALPFQGKGKTINIHEVIARTVK